MKNLGGMFLVMFLLVGSLGFVLAVEYDDEVREAKKIGFFENQIDRIKFAFAFNKEKKITQILERAEKRLAEAELLSEEDPEAYERAQAKYDAFVSKAEEILANIEARSDNANDTVDEIGRIARIEDMFERHRAHVDEIYTRVLERFELNNASDEKIERFEMFYDRALNRSYRMKTRIIEKQERNIDKYRNSTSADDGEVAKMLVEVEEREGLREIREERNVRAEIRIERVADVRKNQIAKMRLRLRSSSLDGEERAEIKIKIREATRNINDFKIRVRERIEEGDRQFQFQLREAFKNGEFRTEIRILDEDDSIEDALKAEEDALEDVAKAAEDATDNRY